jgi:hypothetical protein
MLHDPADNGGLAIAYGIDIDLDGILENLSTRIGLSGETLIAEVI